jgi:transcriptional regulator with XRE-family HTH domain
MTGTPEQRVGAKIKARRKELGCSQEALAQAMRDFGYDTWRQSTIAKVESAGRPLRLNELIDIAAVLEMSSGELMDDLDDREQRLAAAGLAVQRLEIELAGLQGQADRKAAELGRARDREAAARQETRP